MPCDVVPSTFRREVFERASLGRAAAAPDGVTRMLFVGQVGRRKGTFDVLRALPEVRDAGARVHVTFVGPPELTGEWDALLALRAELGLEAMTEFAGQLQGDALYDRYRSAVCFVSPSYNEGLPVVLFEAGVFELPVLTTPVGSIPDLVVDGRNGLLVAPGDRAALVAALVRMVREPARARAWADSCKRTCRPSIPTACARVWRTRSSGPSTHERLRLGSCARLAVMSPGEIAHRLRIALRDRLAPPAWARWSPR